MHSISYFAGGSRRGVGRQAGFMATTSGTKKRRLKKQITRKPLMKAKFSEVVALNLQIDPEILKPLVPKGLELNFFKDETYVSLVAMMLRDVRVWGIPIHIASGFEEVNLRFYVLSLIHI